MSAAVPWRQDRMVGLAIGTRVHKPSTEGRPGRFGTVMPHEPEYSRGGFPVRFDDGFWEMLDVSYVTVVAPPEGGPAGRRARRTPECSRVGSE